MQSSLPPCFWTEAVNTANYIRNRSPSKSFNGKTPFEVWTGRKPDVSHYKEFGCRAIYLNREPNRGKFDSRTKEGIFWDIQKKVKVWLPDERKVKITRDVKFLEVPERKANETNEFLPEHLFEDENVGSAQRFVEIELSPTSEEQVEEQSDEEDDEILQEQIVKRCRGRPRIERTGTRGRPRKIYRHINEQANTTEIEEEAYISEIPMRQAMNSVDADEWYNAMATEKKSIIKNDIWELVERPKDREIIGSRIILRNKYAADGRLERRKARLVAQGFSQRPGIHFKETFAPVARLT